MLTGKRAADCAVLGEHGPTISYWEARLLIIVPPDLTLEEASPDDVRIFVEREIQQHNQQRRCVLRRSFACLSYRTMVDRWWAINELRRPPRSTKRKKKGAT